LEKSAENLIPAFLPDGEAFFRVPEAPGDDVGCFVALMKDRCCRNRICMAVTSMSVKIERLMPVVPDF
jgi:hypothetical protein